MVVSLTPTSPRHRLWDWLALWREQLDAALRAHLGFPSEVAFHPLWPESAAQRQSCRAEELLFILDQGRWLGPWAHLETGHEICDALFQSSFDGRWIVISAGGERESASLDAFEQFLHEQGGPPCSCVRIAFDDQPGDWRKPALQLPPVPPATPAAWKWLWEQACSRPGDLDACLSLFRSPLADLCPDPQVETGRNRRRVDRLHQCDHRLVQEIQRRGRSRTTWLDDQPIRELLSSYPLAGIPVGRRTTRIDADLLMLAGPPDRPEIWIVETPQLEELPWVAMVNASAKLRLALSRSLPAMLRERHPSVVWPAEVPIRGAVLAGPRFWLDSPRAFAQRDALAEAGLPIDLVLWDPLLGKVKRAAA